MENNVNINKSECLVVRDNIGSTEYINICTGETNRVDWGVMDWGAISLLTIVIIAILVAFGMFIKTMKEY